MWTHIKGLYNSNKYAILWTAGYVFAMWAIMRYMFNFNIFSATRWHQLMHAHLHGFAGLVFGILILAMVPLYVATTIVITRKNEPLFNFKITILESIKIFLKNAFIQTPMDEPTSDDQAEQQIEPPAESEVIIDDQQPEPIPESVPPELRVAYTHARDHIERTQTSAYDLGHITKTPNATPVAESATPVNTATHEMPIPTDFDISDTDNIVGDIPIFTDLKFDDDDETIEVSESESINEIKTSTDNNDIVIKYLTAKSVPYKTENDVVITNTFAIVSHTDSDFWVADNESWFAAGKIRRSPIVSLMETATAHNVQPVLYLGADNIMDIDDLRTQWESSGIRVISDLKDLI